MLHNKIYYMSQNWSTEKWSSKVGICDWFSSIKTQTCIVTITKLQLLVTSYSYQ